MFMLVRGTANVLASAVGADKTNIFSPNETMRIVAIAVTGCVRNAEPTTTDAVVKCWRIYSALAAAARSFILEIDAVQRDSPTPVSGIFKREVAVDGLR